MHECRWCDREFVGPPVTDEDERLWLWRWPDQWRAFCSTDCRDSFAEHQLGVA